MLELDLQYSPYLESEEFQIFNQMVTKSLNDLDQADAIIYQNMISLIGDARLKILNVPSINDDMVIFRFNNFNVKSDRSISDEYIRMVKDYSEYSSSEKLIIDEFIDLMTRMVQV